MEKGKCSPGHPGEPITSWPGQCRGALDTPHHEPCDCAHGDGGTRLRKSWSLSTPQAGEPPALPSAPHLVPCWHSCLPRVSGRRQSQTVESGFQASTPLPGWCWGVLGGVWRSTAPYWKHSTEDFVFYRAKTASPHPQPVSRVAAILAACTGSRARSVPAARAACTAPLHPPRACPRPITGARTPGWTHTVPRPFQGSEHLCPQGLGP